MTIDSVREICRALPGTTEDIKWGQDLVFSIGGKMYAVVCLEPPHTVAFKCTPEEFAELVERDGIIPAPYLARAMWVQEQAIGDALDRQELRTLLRASYELVQAKLPKRKRAAVFSKPAAPGSAAPSRREGVDDDRVNGSDRHRL
jgi:predicted DNA-binding protein (MmcQ/YjbR family)